MRKEDLPQLEALCGNIQSKGNGFSYTGRNYTPYNEQDTPLSVLTRALYAECYVVNPLHTAEPAVNSSAELIQQFIQQLSAVNRSQETSDAGWTLNAMLSDTTARVSKFGVTRTMKTDPGFSAVAGTAVTFRSQREDTGSQPGFYYLHSNALFEYTAPMARVYWNTVPEGALFLVESLSTLLNAYRLPFLFKCLSDPGGYRRRDGCVLYIGIRYLAQVLPLLKSIHKDLAPLLKNDTPLFTQAWQPGTGICESPPDGNSFGISRMQIVARGLLNAFAAGDGPATYLRYIENAFTSAGLDPELPFLEAGSQATVFIKTPIAYDRQR